MPLTKAAPPVTEIDEMESGTTSISIPNAGGDIDINVAGADILDITQTDVTSTQNVQAPSVGTEQVNLSTTSGSTALLRSGATENALQGQSNHPFVLGTNLLNNLIMNTDGTTTLMTQGTLPTHLVDKDYVDSEISNVSSGTTGTLAQNGEIDIPTAAGTLGLKWGRFDGLVPSTLHTLTYAGDFGLTPYPTQTFIVMLTPINNALGTQENNTVISDGPNAAGFQIFHPTGDGALNPSCYWFAIGN